MGMYEFTINEKGIDPSQLFLQVTRDLKKGLAIPRISAKFHNSVAEMTERVCTRIRMDDGINGVVLSGGVWQNVTLLSKTLEKLRKSGFQVYFHKVVPTNDGGLAIGQAMIAAVQLSRQ